MSLLDNEFITLSDIGIAYRKAKVDLYYEREHPNAFAICEYEQNLEDNLAKLHGMFSRRDFEWTKDPEFVGSWAVIPKRINLDWQSDDQISWLPSDPNRIWQSRIDSIHSSTDVRKPIAEFRLVGNHSINFHVVLTLWMLKVGHIYDAILGPEVYGSRLMNP